MITRQRLDYLRSFGERWPEATLEQGEFLELVELASQRLRDITPLNPAETKVCPECRGTGERKNGNDVMGCRDCCGSGRVPVEATGERT